MGGQVKGVPAELIEGCSSPPEPINGILMAADPDEDCPFLEEHGCGIQHSKPDVCRAFDCRHIALTMTRDDERITPEVWNRGQEMLK